ncbi:hypothetical protein QAD02_016888, partial [Eretmocerus hayati]
INYKKIKRYTQARGMHGWNGFYSRQKVPYMEVPFCAFGVFCNQGFEIQANFSNHRIWTWSINLLSWILIASYSSQMYILMAKSSLILPFKNLASLYQETDYSLLLVNNLSVSEIFEARADPLIKKMLHAGRVYRHKSMVHMWEEACLDGRVMPMFKLVHELNTYKENLFPCDLKLVEEVYGSSCVSALVPKNFLFKETLNYGISKLHENGIISAIRRRYQKNDDLVEMRPYTQVEFGHVSLILMVYGFGFCLASMVFMVELILRNRFSLQVSETENMDVSSGYQSQFQI